MKVHRYIAGLAAMLLALPALAADIDGRWKATVEGGPNGPVELQFDLTADGERLAGTLGGPVVSPPVPITDGVIRGAQVSFSLAFPMADGAPPLVIRYTGTLQGDELNLVGVFDMGQGPVQTPVLAKRAK